MRRALLGALLGVSCTALTPVAVAAQDVAAPDGRAIYNFRCYFCHGYSGNAKTVAATYLKPPPVDFTRADPHLLTRDRIAASLREGRSGTAMKSFASVLSAGEITAVAAFVFDEFVQRKAPNTSYHTPENGWAGHERHHEAFPFATGEIPLSRPWNELTPEQARGKRLFLDTCISCHDRADPNGESLVWDARPLSFPRNNFSYSAPQRDATAGASPYALHDIKPNIRGLSATERRGERLFQSNCAFCHAADGTGKNWIGSFLEPHPRNLRDPEFMRTMTRSRFVATIRDGLPNTSMPAWKNVLTERDMEAVAAYVHRAFHPLATATAGAR